MGTTVTFGELMMRLAPPGFERILQTPVFHASFGGAEANVAVSLASLGLPAAFVTVLPADNSIADAALAEMRKSGIDTSHVLRGRGRMGVYYLEPGVCQRPPKVLYDRDGTAIALASPQSIDWESTLKDAAWLHVTGITPAISESAACLTLSAARTARDKGITVSCDLNYRKSLWQWGKTASQVMPGIAEQADVLMANEEDVQLSLGMRHEVDVHGGTLETSGYRDLTESLLLKYPRVRAVAVTLRQSYSASHNGWSACLNDRSEFYTSRSYEITHIVDRVGAGDSFSAGLIFGLQKLDNYKDALEFAVAASCLKHSIPGDFNRLSLAEVQSLLDDGGSGRVQR
jgi:2-dehydro-3-deoxygluconokinase